MIWMISANGKMYDHATSFATNGFIDWRQRAKFNIGDIVYIYCTRPLMKVMYKCEVIKHSLRFSECIDDAMFWNDRDEYERSKSGKYARLKLLEQVNTNHLDLDALKAHGLSAAPQGPIKVSEDLRIYIEKYFNDFYVDGYFTDVHEDEQYHEGHVRSVKVNIFERSSIARGKCIEHHGDSCLICGLNFGEKYGELGKGFIHIHHLKPLHSIRQDYVVDYKKDLIPVCPNCHAIIHRIPGGEEMSIEKIREILTGFCNNTTNTSFPKNNTIDSSQASPATYTLAVEQSLSERNSETVQKLEINTSVTHTTYGIGRVKSIDNILNRIVVSFPTGDKVFALSDAIKKRFLTIM